MLNQLAEQEIGCPYCGEPIILLIDPSVEVQTYIEDCEVCCRPIVIKVSITEDDVINVQVRQEDD